VEKWGVSPTEDSTQPGGVNDEKRSKNSNERASVEIRDFNDLKGGVCSRGGKNPKMRMIVRTSVREFNRGDDGNRGECDG